MIALLFNAVYLALAVCLTAFGVHRLALLRRFRWSGERAPAADLGGDLPRVTVQLPLFNERTVARRLLRAVGALDYPSDRLEVQVLDDSTDETRAIVDDEVRQLGERGIDAKVLRRAARTGFKAGALELGMREARGELLCVFDADFLPPPQFLRRTVGAFDDPAIGMVQARWGHANRDEHALTRAEATLLDGHFVIEHKVRCDTGLFFNFNGTAGIWRRAAIEDAGGWQHDTLTEDLDLSYRAQLAGWRFAYAPSVVAPAEVPADIASFQSQQNRWAKGSVQVARKLGGRILRADLPLRVKLEAFAHLGGNVGYPLLLVLAAALPWAVFRYDRLPAAVHAVVFLACTVSVLAFYETSQRALGRRPLSRAIDTVCAVALGVGMSVSQTGAVLSGLRARTGEFVRTPKRGNGRGRYRARTRWPVVELLFAGGYAWSLSAAVERNLWGSVPFLLLFFSGFAWVAALSLRHCLGGLRTVGAR